MSDINIITPISIINDKNNNTPLNTIPYHALIDYCAIRKQFSRIIPNYYINTQNNLIISNKIFSSDSEEYNKLKNEIKSVEDFILALKEKKEKKLEQIKELREIMRKVGNKKINITDKKIIRNNYYNREKNDKQCFKGINKDNVDSSSKCMEYIEEAKRKLSYSNNFDMTIDNMLIKIWEEFNEKYNRR